MNTEMNKKVCIFCGHRKGKKKIWSDFAKKLGDFLGKNGYTLFYGGGSKGIMGTVAMAAKKSGARVHGVITENLAATEPVLKNIDEITLVATLSERKQKLVEQCGLAIVLPGGIGTIDELFDLWAKIQLGIENKILILVDVNKYYSKLLSFLRGVVQEDFLSKEQFSNIRVCQSFNDLITELNKLDSNHAKHIH